MSTAHSTVKLSDGATLAYEIHGSYYLGMRAPIVLVCGMSNLYIDFERLTRSLSQTRPVLIYNHRGMGNSTLAGDEELTIELLARDLAFLLHTLRWKEVSMCGYSMGGVVAQQLLVLPYHESRPIELRFRTTHLFLVATRSVVHEGTGIGYKPPPPGTTRTLEERKAGARRIIELAFDPKWIADNGTRFNAICDRVFNGISNRPGVVIGKGYSVLTQRFTDTANSFVAKQGIALQKFNFVDHLSKLPADMKVLVIHGNVDQVIPRRCGEDVQARIRGAVFVETGTQPGQVPSLDFGHYWYEYFDIKVWQNVVNTFIDDAPPSSTR